MVYKYYMYSTCPQLRARPENFHYQIRAAETESASTSDNEPIRMRFQLCGFLVHELSRKCMTLHFAQVNIYIYPVHHYTLPPGSLVDFCERAYNHRTSPATSTLKSTKLLMQHVAVG